MTTIKIHPTVSEVAKELRTAYPNPTTRAERRRAARQAIANLSKGRVADDQADV